MAKPVRKLTEKQEKFIEYFLGECHLDPIKAYDAAGYAHTYNKYSEAMKILNSDSVVREINQRMADKDTAYWINDNIIVKKLWEEATDYSERSTQAARINALVWIGKHIGMWQEKKEEEKDTRPVIQITNYGVPEEKFKEEASKPEVEREIENVRLPEGVQILDYGDKERKH